MNNDTLQKANNKGTDQSAAWMRKLVCAFVVHKPQRQVFLCRGPFDVYKFLIISRVFKCLKILEYGGNSGKALEN